MDTVKYINSYCQEKVLGSLLCDVHPQKGRILVAEKNFACGTKLFAEAPLHLVAEAPKDPAFIRLKRLCKVKSFAHAPLWYWAALSSLTGEDYEGCNASFPSVTMEQQQQLLMFYHPEPQVPSEDSLHIVHEFWGRNAASSLALKLESLLAVWLLNCFEHSEEPVGFSTFFLPAFISHDCRPNCMWHYEGDCFTLRARRNIPVGEEITVSYLAEESLLESIASRRSQLEATKHFLCNCSTCRVALDPVRGFRCLGCQKGEIFFECGDTIKPCALGACRRCGFLATAAQANELVLQEAKVEELVQEWDRKEGSAAAYLTEEQAQRLEENMSQLFSDKHWLRDRVARHLVAYYEAAGDAKTALSFANRCSEFTAEVYPGFSALQAWSMETQGDLQLRLNGFQVGPDSVEGQGGQSSASGRAVAK
ncbi:unnamed protein product [Cladocopium goreaui]|uniref:N-lysine methyltransferase SMYD2-B (Histon e methyltransferase SMYD2-B) (SET and MYN D domain-containing protein 2B) n=1 Tax=Cladocopium goreaui TaxID=2562237 RepID=A0A9P1GF21_9DINO|nr:unnamed protein product [Cladocopium goreaui]